MTYSTYEDISGKVNQKISEYEVKHIWHVIAYSKGCGESLIIDCLHYIDMSYGELRFEIYSSGTSRNSK